MRMRRQTASRRWKAVEPYRDSKSFTGLQDYKLAASWASRRLNKISHKHDADYTNYLHPYITYTKADENWIRRSYADNSYTAAAGQLYFGLKKALLPRSRRDWSTILKRPRLAPPPRVPQSLRAPTVTHRTTNLVQAMPKYGRTGRISYLGQGKPYIRGGGATINDLVVVGRRNQKWNRRARRNTRRGRGRSMATWNHLMNCVENKVHDYYAASHQSQQGGAPIDLLDGIIAGFSKETRVGNKIFLRSIDANGALYVSATGGSCQYARIMVVQDKMSMGSAPTAADLLDLGTVTAPTFAYRQLDKTSRFNVLMDKKIELTKPDTVNGLAQGKGCYKWKFHKSFPTGLHVTYDSDSGATANIMKNNIWVFIFSDNATAGNNPSGPVAARIRYTD